MTKFVIRQCYKGSDSPIIGEWDEEYGAAKIAKDETAVWVTGGDIQKSKDKAEHYGRCLIASSDTVDYWIIRLKEYKITGQLKSGKRFAPIFTSTPYHYNIWRGTIWLKDGNEKWVKVKRIGY